MHVSDTVCVLDQVLGFPEAWVIGDLCFPFYHGCSCGYLSKLRSELLPQIAIGL